MSYMNRGAILKALYALSETLTWGTDQTLAYRSRRVKLFSEIPLFPALCQAEHDETRTGMTGMPDKTTLGVAWMIYHQAGLDPDSVPADTTNAILDAIDNLFPTDGDDYQPQTLGGLVTRVSIVGKTLKENGDLGGNALIIVPLKILVP